MKYWIIRGAQGRPIGDGPPAGVPAGRPGGCGCGCTTLMVVILLLIALGAYDGRTMFEIIGLTVCVLLTVAAIGLLGMLVSARMLTTRLRARHGGGSGILLNRETSTVTIPPGEPGAGSYPTREVALLLHPADGQPPESASRWCLSLRLPEARETGVVQYLLVMIYGPADRLSCETEKARLEAQVDWATD